jgi:hypothetical protein
MDDARTVLEKADRQLAMISTLYGADLELQRLSPTLRAKIKAFLDSERSALDHLAERVVASSGVGEVHTHYPLSPWEAGFEASIDKNMPGVRESRPDLAQVIARHQPFSAPGLAHLRDLLVDDKWQRLSPRTEPAPEPPPAEDGPSEVAAAAAPPRPPGMGAGLTGGVFINGVEHDPVTLQPLEAPAPVRRETVYVAWLFEGSEESALLTLEAIHAAVGAAIDQVSASLSEA